MIDSWRKKKSTWLLREKGSGASFKLYLTHTFKEQILTLCSAMNSYSVLIDKDTIFKI